VEKEMLMPNKNESTKFQDHFSKHAGQYAQYRPKYPDEIYAYLASIAPGHTLAWDCGTGNGQAAIGLAKYFDKVHATDASVEQISLSTPHPKVDYQLEPAENVSLNTSSADLVTVAVAIHWFDFGEFYREAKRVLRPNGILSAWTYNLTEISPEIDQLIRQYYSEILGGYWPERIRYIEERYQTIPFPFKEITPPSFEMEIHWDLNQCAGFLDSWSAAQRYKAQSGSHPLELIWPELVSAWGGGNETRRVRWPLHFRIGRHVPDTTCSTDSSALPNIQE
jgi:ubiquinone/menaquinone biosynthesis C-methylase UbiE